MVLGYTYMKYRTTHKTNWALRKFLF